MFNFEQRALEKHPKYLNNKRTFKADQNARQKSGILKAKIQEPELKVLTFKGRNSIVALTNMSMLGNKNSSFGHALLKS